MEEVSIYKDKDDKEYIGGEKTPKGLGGSVHILLLAIPHKFGTAGVRLGHKKTKLPRNQNIKRRLFKHCQRHNGPEG